MPYVSALRKNLNYRQKIWRLCLVLSISALGYGLVCGEDISGKPWTNFALACHMFAIGVSAFYIYQAPRRFEKSLTLLRHSSPTVTHVVVEETLTDGELVYEAFIRGDELAEAGYTNYRATIQDPYPQAISAWVDRDKLADVWFTKRFEPQLVRIDGEMLEVGRAKSVMNRWNS